MKTSAPVLARAGLTAVLVIATPVVAYFEGNRLRAYLDPVGIPTICYGHTEGVKLGRTMSQAECDTLLAGELGQFARGVDDMVVVDLPPARHAALTSFAYNIGLEAFRRSSLLKYLNAGRTREACDQLLRWVNAGGRQLPGLVRRRSRERELCLEGL